MVLSNRITLRAIRRVSGADGSRKSWEKLATRWDQRYYAARRELINNSAL
jgi:hypothetical protein